MSKASQVWEYKAAWQHLNNKKDWQKEVQKSLNELAREGWELFSIQLTGHDNLNEAYLLYVYKRRYNQE